MVPRLKGLILSSFFWTLAGGISLAGVALVILSCVEEPVHRGYFLSENGSLKLEPESKKLIIGVLSAQNNFERRQVIRNTWGRLLDKKIADLKFIVGSEFCPIPTADRISEYKCEKWTPALPKEGVKIIHNIAWNSAVNLGSPFFGFTFVVKQNISVLQLSVYRGILTSTNRIARVVLINAFSSKVVASATFLFDPSSVADQLITKRIVPVVLPINFEGEFRVVVSEVTNCSCPLVLKSPSAAHVYELLDSAGNYIAFSEKNHHALCGGFGYDIENKTAWEFHSEGRLMRELNWSKEISSSKTRLSVEKKVYGDVLFAEVVDVYAHLASKTLFFLNWASSQRYDFALKTDDDVFLDLTKILDELRKESDLAWDWWSCFKIGWPAPNAGKWRDRLSTARTYPPFPSGSGYVVRMSAVDRMLSRPRPKVSVGEDVAVGLLADGLNFKPLIESGCYWSCNGKCAKVPCNVPELSPELMRRTWESYYST